MTTDAGEIPLYYHMDHMGSSEFLTSDVTQRVTSWTSYDEWGNITHNAVLKCGTRELDLVKTYTGHERDSVLGMYYAKARMYDTADKHGSSKGNKLGDKRFTAVDPVKGNVRNSQSLVQYTYVLNNPLMYVDPLGMMPTQELRILAETYTKSKTLSAGDVYLYCLARDGGNVKLAAHETAAILVAESLFEKKINYTLEHIVPDPRTDGNKEIDVLADNQKNQWIYEIKPFGVGNSRKATRQIKKYYELLDCNIEVEELLDLNYPIIPNRTVYLFSGVSGINTYNVVMELNDLRNGVVMYKLKYVQGVVDFEINTVKAADYAKESGAVDRMKKIIGQKGIGDLNKRLATNYTLNDLRSEVMLNDLKKAAAYGGTAFLLYSLVQTVGVPAVISAAGLI